MAARGPTDAPRRSGNQRDVGYIAAWFIEGCFPHSAPKPGESWRRSLPPRKARQPRRETTMEGEIPRGLGARLAAILLSTDVVMGQKTRLTGAGRLQDLLERLGLGLSGGARSGVSSLRREMVRVLLQGIDHHGHFLPSPAREDDVRALLAQGGDPIRSGLELRDSWVYEVQRRAVPIDLDIVRALGKDLLALDLYLVLTWQSWMVAKSGNAFLIRWQDLGRQLGSRYGHRARRMFRWRVRRALERIQKLYPALGVQFTDGGLLVLPYTRPSVHPKRETSRGWLTFQRGFSSLGDAALARLRPLLEALDAARGDPSVWVGS